MDRSADSGAAPGDARDSALSRYRRRRDFARTAEPDGSTGDGGREGGPLFVVQRHIARSEHYDLRLEVDGVLKSWAVPKGPSTDPDDKRLAVPTEDHPLDYAGFEGTIPADDYGGGTVLVWDTGTYANTTGRSMAEGLAHGHVSFELNGEKLTGRFALHRFRPGGADEQGQWLLVKEHDSAAGSGSGPVSTRPESVRTGRGIGEVADEEGRTVEGRPRDGDRR
ncbi:DNA polymerase ligase N-terminal domain-containing protein [Streptomonospora salina]|uniref:DNA ligase D-like protein (Predicted 3'-phosphoesterase) n=1 Tax=Streptomonospora salina TaxID=104205 RepID=A0A841E6F1_9ACTN|nr:DNA polymerase ligase N-terminal domain-containing protein [Streptomonospora salina]MBB5996723.1 DNA ligase D-like protein (predicted 3'-phosphoesterase) [Streptomonospora salina]